MLLTSLPCMVFAGLAEGMAAFSSGSGLHKSAMESRCDRYRSFTFPSACKALSKTALKLAPSVEKECYHNDFNSNVYGLVVLIVLFSFYRPQFFVLKFQHLELLS